MPLCSTMKPGKLRQVVPKPYVTHAPMLGRPCCPLPVCRKKFALVCSEKSETIERIMHRSSTCSATCGNRSLTGMPLLPYCLNFHGDCRTLPTLLNCVG